MNPRLVAELAAAAMELHARRLWERIEPEALFHVRLPGVEHPLAVATLGHDRETYGFMLLRGPRAFAQLADMFAGDGVSSGLPEWDGLTVTVERWGALEDEYRKWLELGGVRARREKIVPFITARPPNADPRPPGAADIRLLLTAVRAMVAADEAGELTPRPLWTARTKVLAINVTKAGKRPEWTVRFEPRPEGVAPFVRRPAPRAGFEEDDGWEGPDADREWSFDEVLEDALQPLDDLFDRIDVAGDQAWFVACVPCATASDDIDEPVDLMFIADASAVAVVAAEVVPREDPDSMAEILLEAFAASHESSAGYLGRDELVATVPGHVTFGDDVTFQLAAERLRVAGATVERADPPPAVQSLLDLAVAEVTDQVSQTLEHLPDSIEAWKEAESVVISKFIAPSIEDVGDRELRRFFGDVPTAHGVLEAFSDGGPQEPLITWFFLDQRSGRHARTACERLLDHGRLAPVERAVLEAYRGARLSVYRVDSTEPGESLEVEDVLTGDRFTLQDRAMSGHACVGELLPLRLVGLGEFLVPVTAGPVIPQGRILPFLERLASAGHTSDQTALRQGAHLFGHLWGDVLAPREVDVRTSDGETLVRLTATFRCADPAETRAQLEATPHVEADSDGGFIRLSEEEDRTGGHVILAHLDLIGDELVAIVGSRERLASTRAWLEALPGVTFERATEAPEAPATDDRLPERGKGEEDVSDLVRASLERHYLAMLDDPIPVFGDRSLRELAATPDGRASVERWIRCLPSVDSPSGPVEPPRDAVRRALGLE